MKLEIVIIFVGILLIIRLNKSQCSENFTDAKSCSGPPACSKNAAKILNKRGKQVFKRCKSGCGAKIPKLGHICCEKRCCNDNNKQSKVSINLPDNSLEKKRAITTSTKNINVIKKIGTHLNSTNTSTKDINKSLFVDKKSSGESSKNKDFSNEVEEIKKRLLAQDKTIKQLEGRVTDTNNKFYASVSDRDAKLLEANDGTSPMNPSNFSYKPKIKFDHKQPSIKIASAYGWSYMPPHYWSVPQKRPPACIPSPENTATVTPIYDKSVPVDVLDYTQVGSILPKFEYNEVHNPDYYYPGWIAEKKEEYPITKGKGVMKSGEYYSMKRAKPTTLKPYGRKIIDEKIHPQKVIRKVKSDESN